MSDKGPEYVRVLLENGWNIVGYEVGKANDAAVHYVLLRKDVRLRSYGFYVNPEAVRDGWCKADSVVETILC